MVSTPRILQGPPSFFAVYDLSSIFAGPGKLLPQVSQCDLLAANRLLVQVGVVGQSFAGAGHEGLEHDGNL